MSFRLLLTPRWVEDLAFLASRMAIQRFSYSSDYIGMDETKSNGSGSVGNHSVRLIAPHGIPPKSHEASEKGRVLRRPTGWAAAPRTRQCETIQGRADFRYVDEAIAARPHHEQVSRVRERAGELDDAGIATVIISRCGETPSVSPAC